MRAATTSLPVAALAVVSLLAFPAPAGRAYAVRRATPQLRATRQLPATDHAAPPPVPATLHLPTAITIETGKARIEIDRGGDVRMLGPRILPFPRAVVWFPGTGVWFAIRDRRLVLGRWRRTLWRSTGRYAAELNVGGIALGDGTVAFSYRVRGVDQLYVARLTGRERHIADNEFPLGRTRGGFYVFRARGRQLLPRGDTGAVQKAIVRNPSAYGYDRATESLYFLAHGSLMRSNGASTQPIASLRRLGLAATRPDAEVVPLGRLVELLTNQRLILLRPDGSLFAEIRLRYPDGALAGDIAIAPRGDAVAFASAQTTAAGGPNGIETVYVARAGAHIAIATYAHRGVPAGCNQWTNIQWHGRWLLYSDSDGHVVVVDSYRRRPAIDLTALAHRLVGAQDMFGVYWSDEPPAL